MNERILAIQRMQDYIDENLSGEIKLSELAQVSLFSPWYSYRLFREHLALTPAEYIRKLRLSRAAVRRERRLKKGKEGKMTLSRRKMCAIERKMQLFY